MSVRSTVHYCIIQSNKVNIKIKGHKKHKKLPEIKSNPPKVSEKIYLTKTLLLLIDNKNHNECYMVSLGHFVKVRES